MREMRRAFQAVWPVARWILLVAGLVAVVGGLLTLAIWVLPGVLVGPSRKGLVEADRLKALNDARSSLVTVVGGLLLFTGALVGAYLTSRTIQVNRESNEITRKGQEATLEIARQGQITERFTRAIDQLGQHGEDKLDIRLGGIYALERIARESAEDHGPIMEVLTAYLREHARARAAGPFQPGERASSIDAGEPPRLGADIQAVATVLGRRPEERRRQEQRPLDLREVDLRNADLSGAQLEGARLSGAQLEGAILRGAQLKGAILRGAQLKGADLDGAQLKGADLDGAQLERALLWKAQLEGANLRGVQLKGADLRGAQLKWAILRGAQLEGAILHKAQLEGAITDETAALLAGEEGAPPHPPPLRSPLGPVDRDCDDQL
jgi:Pentapeptide repeats (8 copies)